MATIIRSATASSEQRATMVQPVAFSFTEMSTRADDFLASVREQAAEIISQAHTQAEKIRRQAEDAGRQAAQDAIGRILDEKVGKQMATLRPAIDKLVTQLDDARGAWQDHWERAAVKLAVAIAERIIRREIHEHPEITIELVREGLHLAAGASDVTVHLNPTDYQNLGKQVSQLAESLSHLAASEVVSDETVSLGGCRVVTRFGEIDQQIEAQLERIEAELA